MDQDAGRKDDASSKDGVGSSPATEGGVLLPLYSAWSLSCDTCRDMGVLVRRRSRGYIEQCSGHVTQRQRAYICSTPHKRDMCVVMVSTHGEPTTERNIPAFPVLCVAVTLHAPASPASDSSFPQWPECTFLDRSDSNRSMRLKEGSTSSDYGIPLLAEPGCAALACREGRKLIRCASKSNFGEVPSIVWLSPLEYVLGRRLSLPERATVDLL